MKRVVFLLLLTALGARPAQGDQTATLHASALPRSWRGYGAADDVIRPQGHQPQLSAEQETALSQWRAVRTLENAETSSPSLAAVQAPTDALRRTRTLTLLHAAALGVFV